jgi:hypothetical protein
LRVLAQVFENYNDENPVDAPFWKPKGGQEFIIPVESFVIMYMEHDVLVKAIKEMLEIESAKGVYFKYEYREHELIMTMTDYVLDGKRFDECIADALSADDEDKMYNRVHNHTL